MALLGFVLLHRNENPTRDGVAFCLWPDVSEATARARFRKQLHLLATAFLPRRDDGAAWLLADKRFIRWNPAAGVQLDLDEFEKFAKDPEQYEWAVELYRGDLLEGNEGDWIRPPRAHLQQRFLTMLSSLIERTQDRGEFAKTCSYATRLLSVDPWREQAVRALMFAQYKSGDRAGAVNVYRRFAENLAAEMRLEPEQATQQLYNELVPDPPPAYAGKPDVLKPARTDNLPAEITAFVGRETEVDTVRRMLSERRLITLTGVGGIGKSRLALEAIRSLVGTMPDGIWLVELASVQDPSSVAARIGAILEIRERPGEAMADTLCAALRSRTLLLILDNCEHLIEAVATCVERLLRECRGLRILATSREPMRIHGEHIEQVDPLPTIADSKARVPTLAELSATPATRLFLIRAADRDKTLRAPQLNAEGRHALAAIAHRLDGIPLAIELAAACTDMFSLPQLERALDDRFELLTSGARTAPPRQQTLRATLDWSFGMLSEDEQRVFERLGVFRGGWTLEAAAFVCAKSGHGRFSVQRALAGLIEKSLIIAAPRNHSQRYNVLETIRLYAIERLDLRGDREAIQRRHLEWCVAAAESANGSWIKPEAARCTRILKPELDNILQALSWSFTNKHEELGVKLAHAARTALSIISLNQMSSWAQLALKAIVPGSSPAIEGDLLWDLGAIRRTESGNDAEWLRSWQQALEIYRTLPDRRREAMALSRFVEIYHPMGEHDKALAAAEAALVIARELGDGATLGYALVGKALSLPAREIDSRRMIMLDGIKNLRSANELAWCARAYHLLAEIEFESGNVAQALENGSHSVDIFESSGLPHFAHSPRTNIPMYLNAAGRFREALALGCALLPIQENYGEATSVFWTLLHVATAAAHLGAVEASIRIVGFFRFSLTSREIAMWPTDRREYEELVSYLGGRIDAVALELLLQEGASMQQDDAVSLALSLPNALGLVPDRTLTNREEELGLGGSVNVKAADRPSPALEPITK